MDAQDHKLCSYYQNLQKKSLKKSPYLGKGRRGRNVRKLEEAPSKSNQKNPCSENFVAEIVLENGGNSTQLDAPPCLGDGILCKIPDGRTPLKILGVTEHNAALLYLVQWEEDKVTEAASNVDHYDDGLTSVNTNVIWASVFNEAFPQFVIKMYESKLVKLEKPDLTPSQEEAEAEKLLAMKRGLSELELQDDKKKEQRRVRFAEDERLEGLDEDLRLDEAANAIWDERRMKDKFDPDSDSSDSDIGEYERMICGLDLSDDD